MSNLQTTWIDKVSLTGQNASIGSTGFNAMPYEECILRISLYLNVDNPHTTAATVYAYIQSNDGANSFTGQTAALPLNTAGMATTFNASALASMTVKKGAGQTVAYGVVVSGSPGSATYSLDVVVERIT